MGGNNADFWTDIIVRLLLRIGLVVAGLVLLGVIAANAQQPVCSPLESLIERLRTEYSETIAWEGLGISPSGVSPMILFQSEKGTWTFAAVRGVRACVVAVGKDGTGHIATGQGI